MDADLLGGGPVFWIRILSALGHAPRLPAIRAAIADPDDVVAACALEQLGRWPEPSPMEDLLVVAESTTAPRRQVPAFASAAQLAERRPRTERRRTRWFPSGSVG
jgi:hypothetical protein